MAAFLPCPALRGRPCDALDYWRHPHAFCSSRPTICAHWSLSAGRARANGNDDFISPAELASKVQRHISSSPADLSEPRSLLPIAADLRSYRALCYFRQGDYTRAEQGYRELIRLAPWDGRGHLGLAKILIRQGERVEARGVMRRGLGVVNSRGRGYLLQYWGTVELRWGNTGRARGLFQEACAQDTENEDCEKGKVNVAGWVSLGCLEKNHGGEEGREKARVCFKRAVELAPMNYYAWQCYGVLMAEDGEWERARKCFEKGVQTNPRNAATYVVWGKMEWRLGNEEEAERLLLLAQGANPKNVHAVVSRAAMVEKRGNLKMARDLLQRAINIKPYDPVVHQAKAMLEFRRKNWKEARKSFQLGVTLDRNHSALYNAWASMEAAIGEYDRARQLLQEGIWADPKNKKLVWLWHNWALLEARLGCNDAARKYFANGYKADSTSVPLLSSWAQHEAAQGQYRRARTLFEKALIQQPNATRVWRLYEKVEKHAGNVKRADAIRERSLLAVRHKDRRLVVSDAMAGDFASSGMWIDIRNVVLNINDEAESGRGIPKNKYQDKGSRNR